MRKFCFSLVLCLLSLFLLSSCSAQYECRTCYDWGKIDCSECAKREFECSICDGSGKEKCNNCSNGKVYTYYTCSVCDGSGKVKGTHCSNCLGQGKIRTEADCRVCFGDGYSYADCSTCDGEGWIDTISICYYCNKKGEVSCPDCTNGPFVIMCRLEYFDYESILYYSTDDDLPIRNPEREGYVFSGWTGTDLAAPTKDLIIVSGSRGGKVFEAKWEPVKYTITLDCNGGTVFDNTLSVSYGEKYELPTPTKDGYTFVGWYDGNQLVNNSGDMGANNLNLVAKWTETVDFEWTLKNNVVVINKYIGKSTKVIIPSTIDGYSVQYIGNNVFENCKIKEVIIPKGVTLIGDSAFYDCSSLTSITIPNSVTSIGDSAFYDCSSLTSITIPNSVTSIGKSAFSWCSSLTSITIPNSVTSIGYFAFYHCSRLKSISLPFVGATKDGASNTHFGYIFGDFSYSDNGGFVPKSLKTVIITGGTSICNSAFSGCSRLVNIKIPDTVTSIGNYAFKDCSGLTNIMIPNSVTSIGQHAFSGCSSLTSVTIPDSVMSIGWSAFAECTSLKSITIPFVGGTKDGTNEKIGTIFGAFSISGTGHGDAVPTSLKMVIITGGTSIGSYAFADCDSVTSITIPDSVTSIGERAFLGCSSLTSIRYTGTRAQWLAISKESYWNFNTGKYTIFCTDGELKK